jgi:hypothetical protein
MAANNEKLSEYQEIIRKIIQAFGEIGFYLIVESMLGVKVKPYRIKYTKPCKMAFDTNFKVGGYYGKYI